MLFVDLCCSLNAYFLESFKGLMAEASLAPVQIDKIMFEQGRPHHALRAWLAVFQSSAGITFDVSVLACVYRFPRNSTTERVLTPQLFLKTMSTSGFETIRLCVVSSREIKISFEVVWRSLVSMRGGGSYRSKGGYNR